LPKAKIWAGEKTLPAFGRQSKTKFWVFFIEKGLKHFHSAKNVSLPYKL
jgi:hypothetical protein